MVSHHSEQSWKMGGNMVRRLLRAGHECVVYRLLNGTAAVIFLVTGEAKSAILREVLEGAHRPAELPAQGIRPEAGEGIWMIDRYGRTPAARCCRSGGRTDWRGTGGTNRTFDPRG